MPQPKPKRRPTPTPWWVAILLSFLGITAAFLAIAYLSWVQVGGRTYWFGVVMVALNVTATVVAIVATSTDARTGRVSARWWAVVGGFVLVSLVLFGFMDRWAPR